MSKVPGRQWRKKVLYGRRDHSEVGLEDLE